MISPIPPRYWTPPRYSWSLPRASWYPPQYWTSHGTQDNPHSTHDIPHDTEHLHSTQEIPTFIMISSIPPRYSRYPATVLMISPHGTEHPHITEFPHGTAHTLYRVLIFKIGQNWLWRLKLHISPVLEMGFENFFDKHVWSYTGKLKMIKWNRFDRKCKDEWAIFTQD